MELPGKRFQQFRLRLLEAAARGGEPGQRPKHGLRVLMPQAGENEQVGDGTGQSAQMRRNRPTGGAERRIVRDMRR